LGVGGGGKGGITGLVSHISWIATKKKPVAHGEEEKGMKKRHLEVADASRNPEPGIRPVVGIP